MPPTPITLPVSTAAAAPSPAIPTILASGHAPAAGAQCAAAPDRLHAWQGWAALALTLCIWAGFFVSLRAGARLALPPVELALVRFGPAGLLFLPLLWRARRRLAALPRPLLLLIVGGAGLPYFLVAGWGMRLAPVADGATLIPGTLPLTSALLASLLPGRAVRLRWPALACIAAGVALMVALHAGEGQRAQGYGFFLVGSLMWSGYTLALRRAGLAPLEAAALISCASLALLLPGLAWQLGQGPLRLFELESGALGLQLALQALGVGLVSTVSYGFAVARLGAERSATAGALTPVLAALLALPLFGERPSTLTLCGMLLVVGGVLWSQLGRR